MQTRSQGPPSFGEQIQQEIYDPVGNLISKRTGYTIPNMGEYGAYDVVVNLISYNTGNNAKFKDNFVNYAREVEKDLRSYATKDNMGFITKAVEILKNELKNDNHSIALAMNYIIEKNPKVLVGFKGIYENQYAQYLKK